MRFAKICAICVICVQKNTYWTPSYLYKLNIHIFPLFLKSFYVVVFHLLIVSLIPLFIPPLFSFFPVFLRTCNDFCPNIKPENAYIPPLKQVRFYTF